MLESTNFSANFVFSPSPPAYPYCPKGGDTLDENTLSILATASRRAYLTLRGRQPVAAVLDVLDALNLETRNHQRPVLSHYHATPTGWHVVIHMPAGIASKEITSRLDYFSEQCNGTVAASPIGAEVHLDIATKPLPKLVPFAYESTDCMQIPLGMTHSGMLSIGLPSLPHLFVAGNTGGGKTCFLRVAAVSLLRQGCIVVVIDLKGLDFHHLSSHALVVDTDSETLAVLHLLNREHNRRKEVLKRAGCVNFQEYTGDMPYLVVLIDELAELTDKDSQALLNRLLRLSRAMGISIIAATQRPSHTVYAKFTDSRMLFAGRLCFTMPTAEDSRLILNNDAAAKIPQDVPGRAIWQRGKQTEVQCMYLPVKQANAVLADVSRREVFAVEQQRHRLPT